MVIPVIVKYDLESKSINKTCSSALKFLFMFDRLLGLFVCLSHKYNYKFTIIYYHIMFNVFPTAQLINQFKNCIKTRMTTSIKEKLWNCGTNAHEHSKLNKQNINMCILTKLYVANMLQNLKYRILFKHILTFLWLDYRDASLTAL